MGNIDVKLYEIRTNGSGGVVVKRKVYGQTDAQQTDRPPTETNHNSSP